jgi:HK97 family phage major capsid protein
MIDIKKAIDGVGESFEEYKRVNDERIKAVESGNEGKAKELQAKLDKIEKDVHGFSELKKSIEQEIQFQRERLEELEASAKTPGKTSGEKLRDEHKEAFLSWVRNKGQSASDEQKLQDLQRKLIQHKDVSIGSDAGGGFAVPEVIAREIERLEKKFSPVRDLVKVVQAGSSDYKELVNIRGATSGWIGENSSPGRQLTTTPSLRERAPTFGELYAYPQASEWSLDDIFFNVENWLAEEVAQEFAIAEGEAVINGTGSNQPTGMINTAPTNEDDAFPPDREPTEYQFVPVLTSLSPAVAEIRADPLIDVAYKLNSAYRAGAAWAMNSNTTGAIRKLKDSNGQYLWQPSLQVGQPDMLLGYRVATWEQLDDIGTDKLPVVFGNFRRAYVLADRVGLRITRDNVTNIGFVKFYIRRREGGTILNNDSLKWIKTTIA